MIDIKKEQLLPLAALPAVYEELTGRRPNISTIHRHRLRGIRGVKLETILIGGARFTSHQALARFFCNSTAAADGSGKASEESNVSESLSAAERALEQDGI